MSERRCVWVLCKDCGYEGLAEPFCVFESEHDAQEAKRMVEDLVASHTLKIIEAEFTPRKEQEER